MYDFRGYFIGLVTFTEHIRNIGVSVKKVFTTCLLKLVAVRHWTIRQTKHQQMDTITSNTKVQMSENLPPLKIHNDDDEEMFEVDENRENNGLKRQRLSSESVPMAKIRNKLPSQPCACEHTVRCKSTVEKPMNVENGTTQLKGDTIQSNGFYHSEHVRENVITTSSFTSEGYFDAIISCDSCDESREFDEKKCTNRTFLNGNDQNCDRIIAKGHHRTRARSSDSIQTEFYQSRKQQSCIQSKNDSDVSIILIQFKSETIFVVV